MRECPKDVDISVEGITLDLERACPGGGPGDGVPWSLVAELLRQMGPTCANELIFNVVQLVAATNAFSHALLPG